MISIVNFKNWNTGLEANHNFEEGLKCSLTEQLLEFEV